MGRLIPAGTGLAAYKRLDPLVEDALVGSEAEAKSRWWPQPAKRQSAAGAARLQRPSDGAFWAPLPFKGSGTQGHVVPRA